MMASAGETPGGGQGTASAAGAAATTKKEHQNQQQQDDAFAVLTDDALLTPIFEFVGVFEYRFVAIINKRFRTLYSEFQKRKIHPVPKDPPPDHPRYYSRRYKYFSTSLTLTASIAKSIEHAKLLMSDMNTTGFHHFVKLRKLVGDGTSYGSLYDVVEYEIIPGASQVKIRIFLRDKIAIRYGNLEMLQWARADGCPWSESACALAARYGYLEVLKWLHANGCPWWHIGACAQAAGNGHLEVLQWASRHFWPRDESTCSLAARNGHLEVLKWAHANGWPWDEWTSELAARNGQLDVLKWLHANGCPWNERTCAQAASNGHLEVLQWARANGCPWNARTCVLAARYGHLEVLQWAHANGCPE